MKDDSSKVDDRFITTYNKLDLSNVLYIPFNLIATHSGAVE